MSKVKRDYTLFFEDIIESIERIKIYTKDLNFERFRDNKMAVDAVLRNLEVIGELAKNSISK